MEPDVRLVAGLAEDPAPVVVEVSAVVGVASAVGTAYGARRAWVGLVDD